MNSLPSFVELMAALGLEQSASALQSPRSTTASPCLESVHPSSPTRSKSSPSLRDSASRHRVTRYSPYSPSTLHLSYFDIVLPPVYGSTSDLPADTPISTYVRRKTPGLSPSSPSFSCSGSPITPPMPLTLPILPTLLPNSASSDSFPVTPTSDCELPLPGPCSPVGEHKPLTEGPRYIRHMRRHTGVRISTHFTPQTSTSDILVTVPTFDQV
ncbi:uncharacterized protein LACBIDRAFT_323800 [Laccaria bicolor S238N-H82]|uniref:Predicted protein n=1 Tax=Laccaria bicolor (strain S238N-H82 / ATCC MYA-4686) TaxID=486041 RepID=B0CYU0_LACBS|nr:uncharacterized protein LACBIDRAFT_323800 [Laccaria bicolor S238N-H82]EDR12510.1 predicted protein [Laccaria bicolor S238N-H82]|eukprot:XP_001876774.1 predicted protein [Laccaria bicolor S238N-H82]